LFYTVKVTFHLTIAINQNKKKVMKEEFGILVQLVQEKLYIY